MRYRHRPVEEAEDADPYEKKETGLPIEGRFVAHVSLTSCVMLKLKHHRFRGLASFFESAT